MNEYQTAALSRLIVGHIRLARSRRETLGWLIASVLKAGSVNLNRLAPPIGSAAQTASVRRRLERFFDEVELNGAEVARLAVAALGLQGKPWHLALDRTNWQIGKTDLNILLLRVADDELCAPLFWRVLDKAGNSNAAERIELMQTFKDTFQNQPVASSPLLPARCFQPVASSPLLPARCFMDRRPRVHMRSRLGNAWIAWLQEAGIPHFLRPHEDLRLREDLHIFNGDHAPLPLQQHAARLRAGCRMSLKGWWRIGGPENNASPPVRIVILRLDTGELLSIASRNRPKRALAIYRKRWKIETLFAALKTRGFNLETTHMTDPGKLAMLMAIGAMAASVACKAGLWALNKKPRRLKAHGRPARSLFAPGLDALRKLFAPRTFIQSLQILLEFLFGNPKQNSTH